MSRHDLIHESLRLRLAWEELVQHLTVARDPEAGDPRALYLAAIGAEQDRLIALLYGHHIGDTLEEAEQILHEVLALAAQGKRPRSVAELGLTREDFTP